MRRGGQQGRQPVPAGRAVWALVVAAAFATLAAGCNGPTTSPPGPARKPLYFDVKALLDKQVQQLVARAAATTKRVELRGATPETVRVAAVRWPDELQIFYQADINKAALRGAYATDTLRLPDGRLRCTYARRSGYPNAAVRRLTVLLRNGQPEEITADIEQENTLFRADKHLALLLEQGRLRTYRVAGTQKLVFFAALDYGAAGTVEER